MRPDRLFGLLGLLSIILTIILIAASAATAMLVSYWCYEINSVLVLAVVVVSLLLAIPALVCHSVFLCCRPHRCPSVAAAVLSGLTACMLFAVVGLWRTAINNYVDNDYFYDDDYLYRVKSLSECNRSTGLIGGAAGVAVLAFIFEIIAITKIEPVSNIAVINVPGVTNNTTVVSSSNSMMMGSFGGQQGGYPGGYAPQQGGNYAPQQGGGYAPQQGGGYAPQQGGGYAPQQGGGYAPQQGGGYAPQQGGGYAPQQGGGYAPQQQQNGEYAPQQGAPQQSLQLDAWAEKPESLA
jgi:hypothetical protein